VLLAIKSLRQNELASCNIAARLIRLYYGGRETTKMSTVLKKESAGYLAELLDNVAEQWRTEFERFVETGDADKDFLAYLDENEVAQQAVEAAFNHQASKFAGLASELEKRRQDQGSVTETQNCRSFLFRVNQGCRRSSKVALQAPSAQRAEVVANSTAALAGVTAS